MEYYSALEKEGNPVICNNMDEHVVHYAKWNKPDTQKANAVWSHLYVESKKGELCIISYKCYNCSLIKLQSLM